MSADIPIIVFDFSPTELTGELEQADALTRAFTSLKPISNREKKDSRSISAEAAMLLVEGVNAVQLLVSSILVFLAKKGAGKVEIVSRSGARLAFPYDTPPGLVEHYREIASAMDIEQIVISRSDMPALGQPQRWSS